MITNLENKLKFIELMDEMKFVDRVIWLKNGWLENDAEHSFHLALMVITFWEDFQYLDLLKCLKIALLHDLVEIYAWDTYFIDVEWRKTKKKRESEALDKLEEVLWKSSFYDFRSIIEDYNNKSSEETIFVYELDKIQPVMQVYMQNWKDLTKYKLKKEEVINNKYKKVSNKFGFQKLLDVYFERMQEWDMFYKEN